VLKGKKLAGIITVTDIAKTTPQLVKVFEDLMWNKNKP